MLKKLLIPLLVPALGLVAMPSIAAPVSKAISYEIDGQKFEGRLVYDNASKKLRPGLLMAPNWMGVGQGALDIARQVAGHGYVVLVADLYGKDYLDRLRRPDRGNEAAEAEALLVRASRDFGDVRLTDGQTVAEKTEPELFGAARVGLGALGVIATVTLQCEPAFALAAAEAPATLDAVLAGKPVAVARTEAIGCPIADLAK